MYSFKKCAISLLLAVLIISCLNASVYAADTDNGTDLDITDSAPIQTINHYRQLTEAELNLNTDALIEVILDSAYMVDLTCGSTTRSLYNNLRIYFNGFQELESRSDAAGLMLAKLASDENNGSGSLDAMYLRLLLSEPVYANMLTNEEAQLLSEAIAQSSVPLSAETSGKDADFTGTIMPIVPPSDAYHQLTVEELNSDTDTLIDLLLDNGYTFDLTLSSRSNTESYNHIRSYFNGFPELESRNDAGSLMLEKLVSGEGDDTDFIDLWLLRILLSQPVYKNMLTTGEIQLLTETIDQCTSTHSFTKLYGTNSATHTYKCANCSRTETEMHTLNAAGIKCTVCGYTGPFAIVRSIDIEK